MEEELKFADVLDRLLTGEEPSISLVYRLSDMAPTEMEAFLERWPQGTEVRRRAIARHMADISEENFVVDFSPVFHRLLSDSSAEVRLAALDGLWDSSNTAVVSPIIRLMQGDPDEAVRAAAAATLGHFVLMGEWGKIAPKVADPIVEALLQVYEGGDEPAVRRAALESLGNAAHPRVEKLIDDAYRQGEEEMQLSALFAMGRSADRRWLPVLVDEMRSPRAERRMEAARAAGNIGHSDPVDRLLQLLDDEDLEVQLAAVTALGQIGSETAREGLARLLDDPEAYLLYDAVEDALEEIEWLGAEVDLTLFDWSEDEDDILE